MELKEKCAYIKGLMDGLELDGSTKEGKVLNAMMELLTELTSTVAALDDEMDQVYDELDAIDEDMDELETYVYGEEEDEVDEDDEDEDEVCCYELTCPNCGEVTVVDEETLMSEEISCASCGAAFDIEFGTCDGNCAACSEECEPEGEE